MADRSNTPRSPLVDRRSFVALAGLAAAAGTAGTAAAAQDGAGGDAAAAVQNGLNVKVFVLNNDAYGQIKAEQRELGVPEYGVALGHIDFAACAEAMGARGFRASGVADLRPAVRAWLAAPGPAVLDVRVDADEESQRPDKVAA